MPSKYLEKILRARVYDVAIESSLQRAVRLSARTGNEVLLKREDEQQIFSFKLRGAYNWRSAFLITPRDDIFPFSPIWQEATGQKAILDGDGRAFDEIAADRRADQDA